MVVLLKRCVGEKINIGSGKETPIGEFADVLIGKLGLKNVEPEFVELRTGVLEGAMRVLKRLGVCSDISRGFL